MPIEPRVLVVILAWNSSDDTVQCVESVLLMGYPRFDVQVVDNASTDDTVAALTARFGDKIRLHQNEHNLMFAGGINTGLACALNDAYDFVLILNNDIEVSEKLLSELVACAERNPQAAATGPKIYYMQPRDHIWFAGGELDLWRGWPRHRGIRTKDRGQFDTERQVDYLTGCAILFKCDVLRKVGVLDPGYHMYAEDADWCFRARAMGYELRYCPRAVMWHRVSGGSGAHSWFKIRNRFSSQMRFLRKHARWYHYPSVAVFTVYEMLRVAMGLLRR